MVNVILNHKACSLIFIAVMIFMISSSPALAQDQIDWRSIKASESRVEFSDLEQLFDESHKWETQDRIAYLEKVFLAAEQLENDSLISKYGEKLGTLYREIDSLSLSYQYLNEALDHAYDLTSRRTALNSLGGLTYKGGDMNSALEYYFKSLEEAKKLNDGSEAYPIGNISEVYANLGDYNNSIKYLKRSLDFAKQLEGNEKAYSLTYDYSYLINRYLQKENADSAKMALDSALVYISILDTVNNQKYQDACFIGYFAVSEYYLEQKDQNFASYYIKKTAEKAQVFYMSSVKVLEARNKINSGNYKQALKILDSPIVQEEYFGKADLLQYKAECFEALGDYKAASKLRASYTENQIKKFGEDRLRYASFANIKYETLQKNEEINALKKDQQIKSLLIKNQRYILFLVLALLGLIGIATYFFWSQFKNRKQQSALLQKEVELKTKNLVKANQELRILNFVASHDIKEHIRNIGSYVGLIKKKLPAKEQTKLDPYFGTVQNSSHQLYTLVEDISSLLSSSKEDNIKYALVDLKKLVDNVAFGLTQIIETNKAEIHADGLPSIHTNEGMMFIIIKNLIENGIKFNMTRPPKVFLNYSKTESHHIISVKDNGIGIDESYHDVIFESFKRLHDRSKYQGSGIGLTIVKVLLEKLKGNIELKSKLGEGAQFIISLPISQ